jgi:hypothetical protein
MKTSPFHPRRWAVAMTPVLLLLLGALVSSAQIDLTGYWAFRVKDGGVNFFQLQQTVPKHGVVLLRISIASGRGGF